jgi:hypothetical protein
MMVKPAAAKWRSVASIYATALFGGLLCLWAITRYAQQIPLPDSATAAGSSAVIGKAQPQLEAILGELRKISTMLVIMAIVTTMMTGPLLRLFSIVGAKATATGDMRTDDIPRAA